MAGSIVFGSSSGSAASANSITQAATYSAGDRALVLVKYYDGGAGVASIVVTDGTNTYTAIPNGSAIESGGITATLFEARGVTPGSYTINASFRNGSNTPVAVVERAIAYWRVIQSDTNAAQAAIDNVQDPVGTGANAVTSTNMTPSAQPNIVFGVTFTKANASSIAAGTANGFTSLGNMPGFDSVAGDTSLSEWKRTTSTAAVAATFTLGSSDSTFTIGAVFGEDASGGSSTTVTPGVGAIATQGRAPSTSTAFSAVRIREVLVNASGQAVDSATGINLAVWYAGIPSGAPDVSLAGLTTDSAGTTSWSIATGSLAYNQPVFYVAYDPTTPTRWTCARMTPSYE